MLSIIVPTLGNRQEELIRLFNSLAEQKNKDFEVVVVSQDNHEIVAELLSRVSFTYKHIRLGRKGLSYARNVGLKHVKGSYVTFSDDDCWYLPDSFQDVLSTFKETKAEIACFQIYDPEKRVYYRNYSNESKESLSIKDLFSKSSIEIFINLHKVDKNMLVFDEDFGLGAKYPSGEENIFLVDLLNKGYKISYFPKIVVFHEKKSIETRLGFKQFVGKGPMFKRMFNTPTAVLLIMAFFLKKFTMLEKPFKALYYSFKETFTYNRPF